MHRILPKGVIVPLVTPINEYHQFDYLSLKKLGQHMQNKGSTLLLFSGIGEGPSIDMSGSLEIQRYISSIIQSTKESLPIYACIHESSAQKALEIAEIFFSLGISAVMVSMPSYYPLKKVHILRYYSYLADRVSGPLFLHNIPYITHASIPLDVVHQLSCHPNILGIQDAEGENSRLTTSLSLWKSRTDFAFISDVEHLQLDALALGADAIVAATANLFPKSYQDLYVNIRLNRKDEARLLWEKMQEISAIYQKDQTLDGALIGLKQMLSYLGLCKPSVFLPFIEACEEEKKRIYDEMRHMQLIPDTIERETRLKTA